MVLTEARFIGGMNIHHRGGRVNLTSPLAVLTVSPGQLAVRARAPFRLWAPERSFKASEVQYVASVTGPNPFWSGLGARSRCDGEWTYFWCDPVERSQIFANLVQCGFEISPDSLRVVRRGMWTRNSLKVEAYPKSTPPAA